MSLEEKFEMLDLEPPDEFRLNCFLVKLEDMLQDEDFQKMKDLCRGGGGIGKRTLEKLKKPSDLFTLLRQQEKLNQNNIIYLQALVWHIGRLDIYKEFVKFAKEMGSTLYTHAPKDKPENGYKHVKFHISGDTRKYNQEQLHKLRDQVAVLFFVPREFIVTSGVEPSDSLLITFMVPEGVLFVLDEITDKEMVELNEYGVNYIETEDKKILIEISNQSPETKREISLTEKENIRLHKKVMKQEHEIDILQSGLVDVNKKLQKAESNYHRQQHENLEKIRILHWLYLIDRSQKERSAAKRVSTFKTLSAQVLFKKLLQQCRDKGYNADLLQLLLEANSTLVRENAIAIQSETEEIFAHEMRQLQQQNMYLHYQISKFKFYQRMDQSDSPLNERDEFYIFNLLRGVDLGVGLGFIRVVFDRLLFNLYEVMSKQERQAVQNAANLTAEEVKYLKEHPEQLLVMTYYKECLRQKGLVDLNEWLQRKLKPLKNETLMQKACELMRKQSTPVSRPSTSKTSSSKPQQTRRGKRNLKSNAPPRRKSKLGKAAVEPDVSDESDCDSGYGEKNENQELKSQLRILINMVSDIHTKMPQKLHNPFPEKLQWTKSEFDSSLFNFSTQSRAGPAN